MTAGAFLLFGFTDFSCTSRINTAANYTVGLQPPFLSFLEGKALLNSEVLHKAGSPESWNYRVQQRNGSSESCPHSASSQGFSESSRADTGQAQPCGAAWNIFTGRIARCLWFNPALRDHTTLLCFFPLFPPPVEELSRKLLQRLRGWNLDVQLAANSDC